MTWTAEKIESDLLLTEIGTVVRSAETVVAAVNRAERLLGPEWIASESSHRGLASAMRIIGMGFRLEAIECLPRSDELLSKLRQKDSSAEAELTGIYLFRSGSRAIEVGLFPKVGSREADFRMRLGDEDWTTVEVTQATVSREQKRLHNLLKRLTGAFKPLNNSFSLEVILQHEPTEDEVSLLCDRLPEFCLATGPKTARLIDGMGVLLLNQVPVGQLPHSEVPGLASVPLIGLAAIFRTDQMVTVKVPFSDHRAEQILTTESQQLPKGKRSLIMISGPSSEKEFEIWGALIRRRFQPVIHTRVGGVCLFDGGMVPAGKGLNWLIQANLITNQHAKVALPSWIAETITDANNAFNTSLATDVPRTT